jgi:hypothetical protein
MRKTIISPPHAESRSSVRQWLPLEVLAQVEVTSEDPAHPIESALLYDGKTGWRAKDPGEQTIRLLFDNPQKLRLIRLLFRELQMGRTQEFTLRWSPTADGPMRDIVRQQYHFDPSGATEEKEEYQVQLDEVAAIELTIVPDIAGGQAFASLAELRLA